MTCEERYENVAREGRERKREEERKKQRDKEREKSFFFFFLPIVEVSARFQ
jgi:hypothetical protein